jgi:osmotically-inducible protein OsmY
MTRTAPVVAAAAFAFLMASSGVAAKKPAGPQPTDLTPTFRTASLDVDRLQVFEIGGVVVIRGRVSDPSHSAAAAQYAKSLGYERVANLIQLTKEPDDAALERAAERELTIHRSLDGCKFRVNAEKGVVHVAGSVRHELQKDVATQLVRNIDGVREVRLTLEKE